MSVCVFIRLCVFVLCILADSGDVSSFLNSVSLGLVVSCYVLSCGVRCPFASLSR